jgi:D-alanine transaminase
MPELASVNGVITPIPEARIPITDRGFLFGDAAYEVIRVYGGRPFTLREHLERLLATCEGMRLAAPPTCDALAAECQRLVDASGLGEAALFIHVSRGPDGQGPSLSDFTRHTVVIRCERPPAWPASHYTDGIKLITVEDSRWVGGALKTVNLLPRVLAFEAARDAGAAEALWVDPDGCIREGLSCNVFAWLEGRLVTPPLTGRILAGITRSTVLGLVDAQGHPAAEDCITVPGIRAAEEVFICSTTREIIPVVRIDDQLIGDGRPGARTRALLTNYREMARGSRG